MAQGKFIAQDREIDMSGFAYHAELPEGNPVVLSEALFSNWHNRRWNPSTIVLRQDATRCSKLDSEKSALLRRMTSGFLVGEQLVTDFLEPLVASRTISSAERLFLHTQIIDEALHTEFFRKAIKQLFDVSSSPASLMPALGTTLGFWATGGGRSASGLCAGRRHRLGDGSDNLSHLGRKFPGYCWTKSSLAVLPGGRWVSRFHTRCPVHYEG